MQCKFCGAELPAGAYKCDMCGQNIRSKKTTMEGGMFGDVLMTAPTEYKSVPMKEPSKLPKIIAISVAALVVIAGIIVALMIFMKPKKPIDQLIDSLFKTGSLDSMEISLNVASGVSEEKTTGYYEFDSREKEARLFMLDEKRENIRMYLFTPHGSYIVKQVTAEEYGKKNGGARFEGNEYAAYAGDAFFYILERDQETGQYAYDIITAMRKGSWDDFYVALAKFTGQYNDRNTADVNNAAVDAIRNAIETVKKDLQDEDKQKNVFHLTQSKESGMNVFKMNPSLTDILTYLVTIGGNALDEDMQQELKMLAALGALAGQSSMSLDLSLSNGRIASGMFSSSSDSASVTSFTIQNANKAETPGRADEFYRAYSKNK
ncbi:MAG: hypothetical protein IKS10_01080 [Lachnospiraceae bacterium]|nr:hypothetical protein [Lachnospiraceae bacterium]